MFVVIFGGIIGFLAFQNVKIFQKRSELSRRAQELRSQIEQLESKRHQLQASISESQTTEYQEKVLREQGLYKKPGEDVVTILEVEAEEESQGREQQEKTWWAPWTWFK